MSNDNINYEIGEIVQITMGRDKNKFAIILEKLNDRFVLLVDGEKKKVDRPKRKNIKHISSTGYISKEIVEVLNSDNRISNAKLRYVLQNYISDHHINDEKGE